VNLNGFYILKDGVIYLKRIIISFVICILCANIFVAFANDKFLKLTISTSRRVGDNPIGALVGDGLALILSTWDGHWEITYIDGIEVVMGAPEKNKGQSANKSHYYYFGVDDLLKPEKFSGKVDITIDYFDGIFSQCILQYDSNGTERYKASAVLTGKNTKEWKTFTWTLYDAGFNGRQNDLADFRLFVLPSPVSTNLEDSTILIREITVSFD
jgi:hypothetical protein